MLMMASNTFFISFLETHLLIDSFKLFYAASYKKTLIINFISEEKNLFLNLYELYVVGEIIKIYIFKLKLCIY